ncbi:MAG: type II toxin-antitoxin system RelE/ParE family toxin [Candidatus Wallbacteria bacterium]|nr:type II toxin-antitoxin system RelE/ParE family toxin [Candidatus Wallbacteria bacterium]
MYSLKFSKNVLKFLKEKDRKIQSRILAIFEKFSHDPYDETLDVKPMRGKHNHFRLRVGGFRILFEFRKSENLFYFYKADSRGDVYK